MLACVRACSQSVTLGTLETTGCISEVQIETVGAMDFLVECH